MPPTTDEPRAAHAGHDRRVDLKWAAGGGVAAATIGFGGMAIVGIANSWEARRLLESVLPTARFAASSYVAGGATILALMLTLLTFSISHDLEFRDIHFVRIRDVAALTTAVIVGSVMLLMFLSFPLDEADVERAWYLWVYYAVLFGGAVTGGLFIAVILMLFYAVRGLIGLGQDLDASELVVTDGDRDEPAPDDAPADDAEDEVIRLPGARAPSSTARSDAPGSPRR